MVVVDFSIHGLKTDINHKSLQQIQKTHDGLDGIKNNSIHSYLETLHAFLVSHNAFGIQIGRPLDNR